MKKPTLATMFIILALAGHALAQVDLWVKKRLSDSGVYAGEVITYKLKVENVSLVDATGVKVSDVLPIGVTFLSASGEGAYDPMTGVWDVGFVAATGSVDFEKEMHITVRVDHCNPVGTDILNTASLLAVDQTDVNDGDNTVGDNTADKVIIVKEIGFTVINTDDAGRGSLRKAITKANANVSPIPDTIRFCIPGPGPHTISPLSALPTITDPVIIDGLTQPGASCSSWPPTLKIELDGTSAGSFADGLTITADNSTVRGLAINRFLSGDGIQISGNGSNHVECNLIGTDVTGTLDLGNGSDGVRLAFGTPTNTIGGAASGKRNLISGNGQNGVGIEGTGNIVQGNYLGTDVTGAIAIGNSADVQISSHNNLIGGAGPGESNVISSIIISGNGNLIQGNFIGTQADGVSPLGNGGGLAYFEPASNNTVGGSAAGAGNVIAYNRGGGVGFSTPPFAMNGTGNAFQRNAFFSNGGLGIDLGPFGVTANDLGDGDTGANNLQNFPVLTSANVTATQITVNGSLNSTANTSFTVEFFSNTACDPSNFGEGETFIGSATVMTDGTGNVSFSETFNVVVASGAFITSTATDPNGNTSEFSQCVEAVAPAKPFVLLADENVEIFGQANSDGDIHANNDIIFNQGNNSQHTGNLTAVDDIIVKKKNKIIGTAAGDEVDNAGTITGGFTENAGMAIIPLPILPDLDVHGKDITVAKSKTRVLDPGDYGKVIVEANGTLKLKSGDYKLYHLKTGEKAVLAIDLTSGLPITINVDKRLVFGKNVIMKLTPSTASTTLITFNIDEDDDDGDNDEGDVVVIGEGARVFGNFIAPETSVEIGIKARLKGAVCAENIRVKKDARFVHHSSAAAFPKESEVKESEVASDQSPVTSYQLAQNYPNPFNPSTRIAFSIKESGVVQLSVYNLQGQEVRTLVSGQMNPGHHTIMWNGRDNAGKIVPSGIYLYKLQVNGYAETRKMTFMK